MENKYFISFNLPIEELESLDEPALLGQIMFWSHALDKILIHEVKGKHDELSRKLALLSSRLDIYKRRYGENCTAYRWAVGIRELCEKAMTAASDYIYPFNEKIEIDIGKIEFDNFIKSRRSVRAYSGEGVSDDTILKILEYASWAPSSCHEQALRYIVIKSDENKLKIKRSGLDIEHSACVIAVLADLRLYSDSDIECTCHDSGAAIQNILLACHYFGLGACYISDTGLNSESIRSILPLKDYEKVTALITVGHYDKLPITPERIEIEKLVRFC